MITAPDIPGHRVGGILGSGGFATVYRSWQLAVGREVAVKVDNRVLLTERDRRRFFREVTAAGRLSGHPHVIDVYDAGTLHDGRPYLVMELCPAGSLNDALHGHGPMTAVQVQDVGFKIAGALAAAHMAGVLHRDIKPANILVNRYGVVGLSDFGLASIIAAGGEQTASRDALTPAFSAPESFRGEAPTVLADIYSLAATLYALLTGRPPSFGADGRVPSLMTIMALHDKPVDDVPGTPPGFMALLRRSLSPDPADRPQTAAAFRDALAALPGPAASPAAAFSVPPAQYVMPALGRDLPTDPTGSHSAAHRAGPDGPRPVRHPRYTPGRHLRYTPGRHLRYTPGRHLRYTPGRHPGLRRTALRPLSPSGPARRPGRRSCPAGRGRGHRRAPLPSPSRVRCHARRHADAESGHQPDHRPGAGRRVRHRNGPDRMPGGFGPAGAGALPGESRMLGRVGGDLRRGQRRNAAM